MQGFSEPAIARVCELEIVQSTYSTLPDESDESRMEARKASEHERGSELHSMSGTWRLSWNQGRLHISRAKNAFELAEGSELDPGYQ